MRHYIHFSLLVLVLLLTAGCTTPAPIQPQADPVVQGSTIAPTEPATAEPLVSTPSADTPTAAMTDTSLPPVATATSLPPVTGTPVPPASATAAPTAVPTTAPTVGPTVAPTVQPTPAPTRTPYPTGIFVASHRGFSDGSSYFVAGEVLNTRGVPVFGAKVIANFYDSGGKLLAAGQTLTSLPMTEPEVANPFRLKVENLAAAVSRYELTVTWEDVSLIEFRPLAVLDGEVRSNAVVGQIRNDQESTLTSIVAAVTFYDATGAVVDTADTFLGGQTLAPGAAMPFTIPIPSADRVYDHFWIEAQGNLNLF